MFNRKKKQIEHLQLEIAKGAAREAEYFRQNNELQRQVAAANQEIRQQIKRINELGKFYRTEEGTGVTEAVIVKPEDLVFRKCAVYYDRGSEGQAAGDPGEALRDPVGQDGDGQGLCDL